MAASIVGTKLGRYELVKYLARAGMADLLLARARGMAGFERFVVIKRLREEQATDAKFVEMFVAEARLSAALHHHNIIQVQDIGEEGGKPYFASEYVHGEDLRTLLARLHSSSEQLPLQYIVTIGSAVAAALHHAHERRGPDSVPLGIVHRDVTPTNILVAYDGNVKVMDFGLAKAAIARIVTQAGVLKGTVPYMAPEQCTGKPAERRSDIFSLGIVLYELATVRRLFKGTTEFHTMSAIVNGSLPRPSLYRKDLPVALEKIILKALARDPADRFQTAEELCIALEAFAKTSAMSTSVVGLAGYMKKLFGERPEPWLVEGEGEAPEATASLDFDGAAVGLAKSPKEASDDLAIGPSIEATDTSPLVDAQSRARSQVPVAQETTEVATLIKPVRPPPVPGRSARGAEPTAIVVPLPSPAPAPENDPVSIDTWPVKKDGIRRQRWAVGVTAVVGLFVGIVVVIGFSGGAHHPPLATVPTPTPTPKPEPKPEPAAPPAKSWDQMTARDYQRAKEAAPPTEADAKSVEPTAVTPDKPPIVDVAAKAEPVTTAPVAIATEPAPIDPTPQLTKPPLKPHVIVPVPQRPAPTKPVAQPAPKPTKTPPKWDPDSLLPKK